MRAAAADQVEPAINKYLVAVLAWAVPGGGHLLLRRRQKGVTFLIVLTLMFATGLWLEGRIFPLAFDLSQPLVGLAAVADLGIGIPYFIAKFMGQGARPIPTGIPAGAGGDTGPTAAQHRRSRSFRRTIGWSAVGAG